MENQHPDLRRRSGPDSYRMTARAVGGLFLAGMVAYIVGNVFLIEPILGTPDHLATVSANSLALAIGAILMLVAAFGDAAHGILMYPVLRRRNEHLAVGYLGARIVDGVLLAVGVMFLLLQIPLGREYLSAAAPDASSLQALSTLSTQAHLYSYEIGMIAVGFAGLILCSAFHAASLVPRPIAIWGLAGYAILLVGSVVTVLGFDLHLLHTIPGGLWELFIGVWLIVKGFSASAVSNRSSSRPTEVPDSIGAPV
jgi:hypothetical protein